MIRSNSTRLAAQWLSGVRMTTTAKRLLKTLGEGPDRNLFHTPEEGYWKTSALDPIPVPNILLDKYVWTNLRKWEKKIATVCVVTGRQYTYAKLRDCSATLAIRLQSKLKLKPRDVVAVCLPNLPEYPIAVLGSIEAGLTVTTVNPIYTAEEIARQFVMSDTKLVYGTASVYKTLQEACVLAKKNIPIVVIRTERNESFPAGAVDFFELIDTTNVDYSALKETGITPDDTVFLPFSSGTTGMPKGVMLSHKNITVNCDQMQGDFPNEPVLRLTSDTYQEVVPCVLPFYHIFGLTVIMLSKIYLGIKLVTLPQFKPEDLIKALDVYKATHINLVPPLILFLTNFPHVSPKNAPNLQMIMSGAAPIGQADVERFIEKFPNTQFMQGYGMTETSPAILMTLRDCKKFDSVGYLIGSTDAKIVPLDGTSGLGLGPNTAGELLIRGPQVMQGYLNNEEANEDIFKYSTSKDRWLRTGDVAYYNEEGMFYITDRMKELIKVKGFQVPPAELEECLRTHPKILDAAVVGVPHPHFGEVPKGIVVLKAKTEATEEEIKKFIEERVAEYKKLEGGVMFVKEIPKSPTGKILRKDVKAMFC